MPDAAQIPPTRYNITRYPEGKVKYPGVDKGGFGTVVAENDQILVIKWLGGSHWVGKGIRGYHSPMTEVLRKDQEGRCTLLISWDNDRKRQGRNTEAT
jgi:hypothetical protein